MQQPLPANLARAPAHGLGRFKMGARRLFAAPAVVQSLAGGAEPGGKNEQGNDLGRNHVALSLEIRGFHAAIDAQDLAGDPARRWRGQEQGRGGYGPLGAKGLQLRLQQGVRAGSGGLARTTARLPSRLSSIEVSSPQM